MYIVSHVCVVTTTTSVGKACVPVWTVVRACRVLYSRCSQRQQRGHAPANRTLAERVHHVRPCVRHLPRTLRTSHNHHDDDAGAHAAHAQCMLLTLLRHATNCLAYFARMSAAVEFALSRFICLVRRFDAKRSAVSASARTWSRCAVFILSADWLNRCAWVRLCHGITDASAARFHDSYSACDVAQSM